MSSSDLRVAVVGTGMMGADHVSRITNKSSGAQVTAVVDPDVSRAEAAAALAPGAGIFDSLQAAIDSGAIDAVVIATPGPNHEATIEVALGGNLEILYEKPLTPDSQSALRVLELEQRTDRPRIQVGFMRRFDPEYAQLRELIASGQVGEVLALHCAHRNRTCNPGYHDSMLITDSVVHEIDVIPFLVGEPIVAVEVKKPRRNSLAPDGLNDPQLVLLWTESGVLADVEMNVNAQFGYQVTTQAVFEKGVAVIGASSNITIHQDGAFRVAEPPDFRARFAAAYDIQVQRWVDAAHRGTIDGPSAWDGYVVAAACEAGVASQEGGGRVEVTTVPKPAFYN